MTGAMLRAQRGPSAVGTHLVLRVELDHPYFVDVGVGDGPTEPIPLKEGTCKYDLGTLRFEPRVMNGGGFTRRRPFSL